jgi:hypothetical protein
VPRAAQRAGAVEKSAGLTGARIGDWFATNITPNRQTGIGTWSIEETVAFLRRGQNKRMVAEGPMAEVVHNSLKWLADADLAAVAEYLKSQASNRDQVPVRAPP